jgi:hypothetical protein
VDLIFHQSSKCGYFNASIYALPVRFGMLLKKLLSFSEKIFTPGLRKPFYNSIVQLGVFRLLAVLLSMEHRSRIFNAASRIEADLSVS